MTYNAFIATRPRSRRQKDDSSATAGSAKISTITARSKSELKELGDRMKWTPGPRTMQEIQEMSSQRLLWEEAWNSEQFQATFQREAIGKHNDDAMKQWAVKRMWGGHATEEESQKAYAAGDRFASNYSQFIRSESNGLAIAGYMRENNLDATRVESYIEAYEALVPLGQLVLSPKAAGIGTEETLTGHELKTYSRLNLLLQPNKALRREDKLSADEWFAQHPELHETRTPHLIAARQARANATSEHFAQAEANTARSGSTAVTDYPEEPSGYLTHSKFNFRKFVAGLSAADFQEQLNDPTFVAALDRANDGNK